MNSNETHLTVAIVYLIISEGLYFNISQKHRFKKVLDFSITVSNIYQTHNRKLTYKYLLDAINDQNMKRNLIFIKKESYIFGF